MTTVSAQNVSLAGKVGSVDATSRNLGKVGVFQAKTASGNIELVDYHPWIDALLCVNRSGGVLLPGRRLKWDTANEGPLKAVGGYAGAGEAACGTVPWSVPAGGVPVGSTFWVFRKGPIKQRFGGNGTAIALGDMIEGGLTGYAQKASGRSQTVTESAALTNSTTATRIGSPLVLPKNSLSAGDSDEVSAQGTCPSTNGTDTLTISFKIGGQTIGTTGAIDVANDDKFTISGRYYFRSVGATAVLVFEGRASLKSTIYPLAAQVTVDTTADINLEVFGQWSAASANDQVVLSAFSHQKSNASGLILPDSRALAVVANNAAADTYFYTYADFTQRL